MDSVTPFALFSYPTMLHCWHRDFLIFT